MKTRLCILSLVALSLAGCAGTALDQDFRRKVKSVDVNEQAGYDPVTKAVTGQVSGHFELRDPDAKAVRAPVTAP